MNVWILTACAVVLGASTSAAFDSDVLLLGFDPEVTPSRALMVTFRLKNAGLSPVKDVCVRCDCRGASRTVVASPSATVFQSLLPGASVDVKRLRVGVMPDQAVTVDCVVTGYAPG